MTTLNVIKPNLIDAGDEVCDGGWKTLDVIAEVESVIQMAMLGRELAEVQMEESEVDSIVSISNPNQSCGEVDAHLKDSPEAKLESLRVQTKIFISNQKPPEFEQIRNVTQLNLSDWQEVMANHELLDPVVYRYLRTVQEKPGVYPDRFFDPNYLPQSSILLLSEGWASSQRYALCGVKKRGKPGPCGVHKFCPYCCWWRRNNACLTYVPAFAQGNWFFLTGSFRGDLEMSCCGSAHDWLTYWNAYKTAFESWVKAGAVNGAYWVDELAVNSFLPTRTLPHVHAIVEADGVEDDDLKELEASVNSFLEGRLDNSLPANLKLEKINSARGLMDRLGYMFKPINILKPYQLAWPRASFYNRHLAQPLNSQVADLVLGYTHVTTRRVKMTGKGNLNPRANNYIGIRKARRQNYRQELAEIRAEANQVYIEIEPENYN